MKLINFKLERIDKIKNIQEVLIDNVLKKQILDASQLANNILTQAEHKAEELIASAKNKAKEIQEKAYQEGYKKSLQELNSAIKLVKENYHKTLKDTESEIVKLAINIAEKILKEELKLDKNKILHIAKSTIDRFFHLKKAKLLLNKEDFVYFKNNQQAQEIFNIIQDNQVKPGECIIEAEDIKIIVSPKAQLEVIKEEFKKKITNEDKFG
jgi:flagellar biosynthesis/type III secretory pathway protein FliH